MHIFSDIFYEDEKELSLDLVKCLNREIRALSEAGCEYIQVDEPLIARKPEKALEYGIDHLKMCFEVIVKGKQINYEEQSHLET